MREVRNYREGQRREIHRSRQRIEREDDRGWNLYDSPLHAKEVDDVSAFAFDFGEVLPKGYTNLKHYIEETLAPKKGMATLLELGGVASSLRSGFTPEFFARSAGINLTDRRNQFDSTVKSLDAERDHAVIVGDMLDEEVHEEVRDWFGEGNKIDLIFERIIGGHRLLPRDPFYMAKQAEVWYELLAEGGLMFIEVPNAFAYYMTDWERHVNRTYGDVLDVQLDEESGSGHPFMRLHKLPGAPENLPLLSSTDVMRNELRSKTGIIAAPFIHEKVI